MLRYEIAWSIGDLFFHFNDTGIKPFGINNVEPRIFFLKNQLYRRKNQNWLSSIFRTVPCEIDVSYQVVNLLNELENR